ncbi:MAG: PQQ-binding-like beta-propeller repeat protein [Bdellovibrionales bacterium]
MKYFSLFLSAFLFIGCSMLQPKPRVLKLDKQWIRSTYDTPYNGYRRAHQMNPVLMDDMVLQGNAIDGLAAFHKTTGRQLWRIDIQNGVASGAQAFDDKLYFGGSDGQFYCVDAYTGRLIWTQPTRMENLSPPLVENGVVYFLSGNDHLFALDAKTGKQKWVYTRTNSTELSVRGGSRPVLVQNTLYIGFSDGYLVAVHIKDGSVAWERQINTNPRFKDIDSTPVIIGNTIYVSGYDNALYALSRADGQVLWRLEEGSSFPVTIAGNRLYQSTSQNTLRAINTTTGQIIWSRGISHGISTQPMLYKEYLIYGESDGSLVIADPTNGNLIKSYQPGQGVSSSPTIDTGTGYIYFISNEGNLHSLKLHWARDDQVPNYRIL